MLQLLIFASTRSNTHHCQEPPWAEEIPTDWSEENRLPLKWISTFKLHNIALHEETATNMLRQSSLLNQAAAQNKL